MKISDIRATGISNMHHGFRKAFIKNENIPLEARFLLILLMTYKGKNAYCWPSQGELGKRMNRNADSIRKYLTILTKEGYVEMKTRGIGRSLLYAPTYCKNSAGIRTKYPERQQPVELSGQEPGESIRHRSIDSGNIEEELKGKELFDNRRSELNL